MVVPVVMDGEGRPRCTRMLRGNTPDVTVLVPIMDRLRERFMVGRVCVVAERGLISAATIETLEQRKPEYVLSARERTDNRVRDVVLADDAPFTPLCVPRASGGETDLDRKITAAEGSRVSVVRIASSKGV